MVTMQGEDSKLIGEYNLFDNSWSAYELFTGYKIPFFWMLQLKFKLKCDVRIRADLCVCASVCVHVLDWGNLIYKQTNWLMCVLLCGTEMMANLTS